MRVYVCAVVIVGSKRDTEAFFSGGASAPAVVIVASVVTDQVDVVLLGNNWGDVPRLFLAHPCTAAIPLTGTTARAASEATTNYRFRSKVDSPLARRS